MKTPTLDKMIANTEFLGEIALVADSGARRLGAALRNSGLPEVQPDPMTDAQALMDLERTWQAKQRARKP